MAQQSFLDKVREWIGGIAWSIFLWSARMTEDEYFDEQTRVAEQRDAPDHAEQKCPNCQGHGQWTDGHDNVLMCRMCMGTGILNRSAGG